jgi:hypothetical protein
MARTKADREDEVHKRALAQFDQAYSPIQYERLQCLQDRRFASISGAQWEGALGEQFENKPKPEVNKIMLAIIRIYNDYRANRFGVKFVSKDGKNADKLADACALMFRANEDESVADEAYDNAFEEAVGGGFGAFRLRTCYVDETDEEDERQTIKFEPIYDADSVVFFDPQAKRQDKGDAEFAFVLCSMSPEAYEAQYGDNPQSWEKSIDEYEFDWAEPDVVWVAEYYEVEKKKKTVYVYETIAGVEERYTDEDFAEDDSDDDEKEPSLEQQLAAVGTKFVRSKKVVKRMVHKWILSGGGVLEDCGYIAGDQIPIVPVYGKRWIVDGVERCMGHVRLAKDAQRLKNMQLSKLAELSALSSIEKPIMTPEQVAGHQVMWSEDNIRDYPYLLVNPVTDSNGQQAIMGPVGYTKPPAIPPAMAALLQITETDMKDILGNQQAGDEIQANVSGKAVELVQNRLDMQSFIYVSNFAKAMKRCGEIWLGMAKDVYVEEGRTVRGLDEQNEASMIELMKPVIGDEGQELENDLSRAKFDVSVEVGPTSDSKRASTVRALTSMMAITQDPETLSVLGSMALMNMQGEGIGEVRDFYRQKLIRMGVIKPNEKEAEELAQQAANTPPDPNAQYLAAAAKEAEAKAMKAQADTTLTLAKTEQTKADTQMTLAQLGTEEQSQVINAANALREMQNGPSVL